MEEHHSQLCPETGAATEEENTELADDGQVEDPSRLEDNQEVSQLPESSPGPALEPDPEPAPWFDLYPDSPPSLRQSTRPRRPNMIFTYPTLGQPAYQSHPTVNAVNVQHAPYPFPYHPSPYLLPLYNSLTPNPYFPSPYAVPCV